MKFPDALRMIVVGALAACGGTNPGSTQSITSEPTPVVSLTDALQRARANEPSFAASVAAAKVAAGDRYLAKTALLPTATYHNQVLVTQTNGHTNQAGQVGSQPSPIFITNNAVHEYISQAAISETIGMKQVADVQLATANAARADAEMEITRRGLSAAVVNLYYGVEAAAQRRKVLNDALDEAKSFSDLTQKREEAREAAHADVLKATLVQQQRQRDVEDADLAEERARLELGILLFADPRTAFQTQPMPAPEPLPARDEVNRLAAAHSPELRSALAQVDAGNAEVKGAIAGYFPDLALNFNYGIDAPQLAKRGPDDVRNLGYSIGGTLDIPVWDWFSTQKKVRQSEIRRDAAKVNLSATQRRLIADLDEAYSEASVAQKQLDLLSQGSATAAEGLRLARMRYEAGEATALEVVDAETEVVTARSAEVDGNLRYENASAALQILMGTL